MSILDEILSVKAEEVAARKEEVPLSRLLDRCGDDPAPGFSDALRGEDLAVIAEIKYSSPSHGAFHCQEPPEVVARSYVLGGAAALSVLTDTQFFQGDLEYLDRVRKLQERRWALSDEELERHGHEDWRRRRLPMLRKDFVVDRYQVAEARLKGASAYLLIVAGLQSGKLGDLMRFGQDLGLEALVEVHDERELEVAVEAGSRLIGVNNRNLHTFEVSLDVTARLSARAPRDTLLVAESGIHSAADVKRLAALGVHGALVGESLVRAPDLEAKMRELSTGATS